MNELLEKIEKLKKILNNDEIIIKIKKLQKEIYEDNELMILINEYKVNPTDDLKYKIYENDKYNEFKKLENELNLNIFKINNKLKKINNKGKCNI